MNTDIQSLNTPPDGKPSVLVQRYLAGEPLKDLAREDCNVYRELYRWMFISDKPEYTHLITTALVDRLAEADHALETAPDKLSISRASVQAKFARQDFERKRPKLYGSQLNVQSDTQVTVRIAPIPKDITPTYSPDTQIEVSLNHLLGEPESEST